ncbi:uncharacterized protein [Eurosta solidaginis]|uniref:uncharacterized protein n=1 Tax=Eurosta solidaginis TaxID=178769 RepID=UPI003531173F
MADASASTHADSEDVGTHSGSKKKKKNNAAAHEMHPYKENNSKNQKNLQKDTPNMAALQIPMQGMLVPRGTYKKFLEKIEIKDMSPSKSDVQKETQHNQLSDKNKPDQTVPERMSTDISNKTLMIQPAKDITNESSEILPKCDEKTNNLTDIEVIKYDKNHNGEFCVFFDTSQSENFNNTSIKNGLFLIDKIRKFNIPGIKTVRAIGRSLYKVFFNTRIDANNTIDNKQLKDNNIRVFIPKSMVETYGVIKQVPQDFSDKEIMENIISDVKVTSVTRILRRDIDNKDNFIPTFTVKISFAGVEIPESVKIFFVDMKVHHFIPKVRQCYNCGRLGHTKKTCKSKNRCILCGNETGCESKCVTGNNKCILCGQNGHVSLNQDKCQKWTQEKNITEIMTIKKLSRREAYDTYKQLNNYTNRFDLLDEEQFPNLPTQKPKTVNRDNIINRKFTKIKYSKVVEMPENNNRARERNMVAKDALKHNPSFASNEWFKVSEIEKLVTLLCQKFQINSEEPIVKLLNNLYKKNANERLASISTENYILNDNAYSTI